MNLHRKQKMEALQKLTNVTDQVRTEHVEIQFLIVSLTMCIVLRLPHLFSTQFYYILLSKIITSCTICIPSAVSFKELCGFLYTNCIPSVVSFKELCGYLYTNCIPLVAFLKEPWGFLYTICIPSVGTFKEPWGFLYTICIPSVVSFKELWGFYIPFAFLKLFPSWIFFIIIHLMLDKNV